MAYVANARMYAVNAAASAAWKDLFEWLARDSGVDLVAVDHVYPAALAELWARPDLGCAFMCGFPYMLAAHKPQAVAAPVPVGAPINGQPVYATRLIVRSDSRYQQLEDTFGGRLGFTVPDSHSGYNALRHHLLPYYQARGARLYTQSIGPLTTPRRVIEALIAGDIDVGPLDGYAFDLMLRHEPELATSLRVIAITDPAPIPFLVASPSCPAEIVAALRTSLLRFGDAEEGADLRDRLCLQGFAPVKLDNYEPITRWDREAREAGYAEPI
ncbi:phosphate/phosphite/phosphonate ABC transporter substrate-binding protein [Rhodopseudomonas sp. B29]|uniref:phosphate/phosphite/phosphonate ABC transporter substrate-binding protein n=1 Tax=Rhodopseudomonas sp. B29 TaxID=95607 RepID=UPI0003B725D0|nr:PhnD/SsuA/transferrin family substrate-binding protein [Rhodopseudomonas sp. B29]